MKKLFFVVNKDGKEVLAVKETKKSAEKSRIGILEARIVDVNVTNVEEKFINKQIKDGSWNKIELFYKSYMKKH